MAGLKNYELFAFFTVLFLEVTAHVLFLEVPGHVKPTSLYLVSPRVSELAIHIDIRSCEVPGYSTTILFRPNEGGHMDDHTIMASSLVPMPDAATTSGERIVLHDIDNPGVFVMTARKVIYPNQVRQRWGGS